MDLFETITKRHSYRAGFKDTPISRPALQKSVQAGLDAPCGKTGQPTAVGIVDDSALIARIAPMHTASKAFQQARAYIACVIDKTPEAIYEGMSFQVEDCAAAVENMLLAITALVLLCLDRRLLRVDNRNTKIGDLLGVPKAKIVRILLPIGIPSEAYPSPAKKPFAQRAWFNSYGRAHG